MRPDRPRRWRLGSIGALLLVLFALGCASRQYGPTVDSDYRGGYGGGGDGIESEYYDYEEYGEVQKDMVVVAEAPAREERASRGAAKQVEIAGR